MIASRRSALTRITVVVLVAAAVFGASCRLVGSGKLNVANDLSGIGADNTTFGAYAPDPGDPFPPAGTLAFFVRGSDFGRPPAYGMNGYLYLVGTSKVCPESEGAPEAFTLADVTIRGIVTVKNGSVDQFLVVPDDPAARTARVALIEINELAGYPGLHLIHRCGTINWQQDLQQQSACSLRTSLEGQALTTGTSFSLGQTRWQFCYGGAAAGSNEKFLFRSENGGASWTLISRTTLGNPPAEAGVGELPNANGVTILYFKDGDHGWLGLNGAGHNVLRSNDGGHNWQEVVVSGMAQGVPVTGITFSNAEDGRISTNAGDFVTDDGGATWEPD